MNKEEFQTEKRISAFGFNHKIDGQPGRHFAGNL